MYRKMFFGVISMMLLGTFFVAKSQASELDKKTIVTVNGPIQVPGKVLPAGTYVFKLPVTDLTNQTLISIFNADETQLIATIQGIPDYRPQVTDKTVFQLEDMASGQPEALKAWFYPGDNSGVEFKYSE
jgi:hypothetical protein